MWSDKLQASLQTIHAGFMDLVLTAVSVAYQHLPGWRRGLYWDLAMDGIDNRWGASQHDFETLSKAVHTYRPKSVLGVGCGTGRLFPLFKKKGIPTIVGTDISRAALEIARRRHNDVVLVNCGIEEISFSESYFDMAFSNRVLSYLPGHVVERVIAKICCVSSATYINELTESDGLEDTYYSFKHDYKALFARHGP